MKKILSIALAGSFVGVLMFETNKADACQPVPCTWGQQVYKTKVDAQFASVGVTAHCGNGILPCKCKILIWYWIYDPEVDSWILWGDNPKESSERQELCGSDEKYNVSVSRNLFPSGYLCCVEMEFRIWSQATGTYSYSSSGYVYWNN